MQYISISLYRKVIQHALSEGIEKGLLNELPIPPGAMNELKAVPAEQFFKLHELADQELGPGFSVRVGQEMKIEDYGVLGLSWRTCSWAGEIFSRSERYFKLLSNTYVFKVEEGPEISHVYLLRDAYRRGVELSNEATLSATVVVLQAMTDTTIFPVEVSFKHQAPEDLESYHSGFKCKLLFGQEDYRISYTNQDLRTRTAKADQSINDFLMQRVDEETKGISVSPGKVVMDIQKLIKDALPSGIPSISELGEHMGMSSRTLTRRLSESGFTFRELIGKTQEEIARELLRKTSRSVGEIAFQTGFSEQSAFNRAFKRWTGQSPLEFRKK